MYVRRHFINPSKRSYPSEGAWSTLTAWSKTFDHYCIWYVFTTITFYTYTLMLVFNNLFNKY